MTDTKAPGAETPQPAKEDIIAIPEDPEQSVYRFIIVAAKRARQLQSGSRPKIALASKKMTRVAIEETRKGAVQFLDPETAPPPEEELEEPIEEQ
jgi:DNA-directed RNA polymerase subunit omega